MSDKKEQGQFIATWKIGVAFLETVACSIDNDERTGFQQVEKGKQIQFEQTRSMRLNGRKVPTVFRCPDGQNER